MNPLCSLPNVQVPIGNTTATVLNDQSERNSNFNNISAKFDLFNTLPVSKILLKTATTCTILKLPVANCTLLSLFASDTTHNLQVLGGMDAPLWLAHGTVSANASVKPVPHNWRLNAKSNGNNSCVRIGGYFTYHWGSSCGTDSLGNACSAELAGVGIYENTWTPFTKAQKSFGVRQAHDYDNLPGGGQVMGEVHIYAL